MIEKKRKIISERICVYGIVQGVGFRPFVSRIADASHIAGSVANRGSYVEIFAEGTAKQLEQFHRDLRENPPERAAILKIEVKEISKLPKGRISSLKGISAEPEGGSQKDTSAEPEGEAQKDTSAEPEGMAADVSGGARDKKSGDSGSQDQAAGFFIIESEKESGDIFVSPDIATCPKCRRELFDPENRRYLHPFINCTACGPRLTILDSMPYDRVRTSMGEFPMCPACEFEYTHAETRRYDAQPVCCNDCGPEVYLIEKRDFLEGESGAENPEKLPDDQMYQPDSQNPGDLLRPAEKKQEASGSAAAILRPANRNSHRSGPAAITAARRAIADGKIIAVKGIGGFHLCCDAKNEKAAARLRVLKRRPMKPFAVMMRDLDAVRAACQVSAAQEEILDGHQKPIILLRKSQTCGLAPSVAPDNPNVGVMLPYAPVQMLLFDYNDGIEMPTDAFVMTSGNVSGAPICRTDEDALDEIFDFCDLILSHNRKIRLRADDSVMDFYRGEPYMIRRSRGYAPLPCMVTMPAGEEPFSSGGLTGGVTDNPDEKKSAQVLAIGGELKNTFCIAKNELFYLSPYVGDMGDLRTVRALEESVVRMEELLEAEPQIVACDMHPDYNTVRIAQEMGLPVLKVQHHYAHILSCMAENDFSDPVIGVSFDGTGYGTDGTIWGGEILIADYAGFWRLGSIRPFAQVGGDSSAREGWRIAASMILSLYRADGAGREGIAGKQGADPPGRRRTAGEICERLGLCDAASAKILARMMERGINTVPSTSAGRLFDGVCALLGIRRSSTFEGEAAMALQFAAAEYKEKLSDAEESQRPDSEISCTDHNFPGMNSGTGPKKSLIEPVVLSIPDDKKTEKEGNGCPAGTFNNSGRSENGITESKNFELPTGNLVRYLTEEKLAGADSGRLAYEFHVLLAEEIAAGVRQASQGSGLKTCALSGGVFQNTLLLGLCEDRLKKDGFTVLRHRLVPPNDGGIALGQAAAAMRHLMMIHK